MSFLTLISALVSHVLVFVDGSSNFAQIVAKILLPLSDDLMARHRNGHGGQDKKNREGDNQFNERETRFAPATRISRLPGPSTARLEIVTPIIQITALTPSFATVVAPLRAFVAAGRSLQAG